MADTDGTSSPAHRPPQRKGTQDAIRRIATQLEIEPAKNALLEEDGFSSLTLSQQDLALETKVYEVLEQWGLEPARNDPIVHRMIRHYARNLREYPDYSDDSDDSDYETEDDHTESDEEDDLKCRSPTASITKRGRNGGKKVNSALATTDEEKFSRNVSHSNAIPDAADEDARSTSNDQEGETVTITTNTQTITTTKGGLRTTKVVTKTETVTTKTEAVIGNG